MERFFSDVLEPAVSAVNGYEVNYFTPFCITYSFRHRRFGIKCLHRRGNEAHSRNHEREINTYYAELYDAIGIST